MPLAKSWFAHLSVVRKLTAIGVLTSTVALILACAVIFAYDLSTSRQRLIRGTGMLADVIAKNSTAVLAFGDAKAAGETLGAVALDPHIVSAEIRSPTGQILARYDRDSPGVATPPVPAALAAQTSQPWHVLVDGSLLLNRPIAIGRDVLGSVFIQADQGEVWERAIGLAWIFAAVFASAFVLSAVIAYGLQRTISEPLLRLTDITRVVTREGRYDVRAEQTGSDEIGELVADFNRMLDEIQQRDLTLLRNQEQLETTVQPAPLDLIARARQGDGGQPREERVPRQHEPRDSHPDERHHRHDRAGARQPAG